MWNGIKVHDDVFIGPNVTFTNDKFPRSKQYLDKPLNTVIFQNASIGANATLLPGITIGRNAMIGAGSVVVKSVPHNAIAVGNPAKVIGFITTNNSATYEFKNSNQTQTLNTSIKDVKLFRFPVFADNRGSLCVGEFQKQIPFLPKRYFLVYDNLKNEVRGEHAHKECQQFLTIISGSCKVVVDNGRICEEFLLNTPNLGIYLPPKIWSIQYDFAPNTVLLVFASDDYDANDYIRNYHEFLSFSEKV